jgi:protein SCO1/2
MIEGARMKQLWFGLALLVGCAGAHKTQPAANLPRPAYEIAGVDSLGGTFRLQDQRGKVVVLAFGFTSCPDICPTTLARLKGLARQLGDQAQQLSMVFVSVDPERDTPERLGAYVNGFDPSFHGVFVERARLQPLLAAYDVVATKRELDSSRTRSGAVNFYSIDHTGGFLLIDKAGQLRLKVPPAADADTLTASVQRLLREDGGVSVRASHARLTPNAGAVYLRIENGGAKGDRLLSVNAPGAELAALHEVVERDGVMEMVPHPEGFAIAPHSTLELAPGGKHVMLMGLGKREPAEPLALELHFEHAGAIWIKAAVD